LSHSCIRGVGSALLSFYNVHTWKAWGFQADINVPLRPFSVSTPLPEDFDDIESIATAYDKVPRSSFAGRLRIAQTLDKVVALAAHPAEPPKQKPYNVVIVITHGNAPEDLENDQLGDAIVNASHFPVSIVFIHIGTYSMHGRLFLLDKKPERSKSTGAYARRLCIQATNGTWDPSTHAAELETIVRETAVQLLTALEFDDVKPGQSIPEKALDTSATAVTAAAAAASAAPAVGK